MIDKYKTKRKSIALAILLGVFTAIAGSAYLFIQVKADSVGVIPVSGDVEGISFERHADIRAWISWEHIEAASGQILGHHKFHVDEAALFGYVLQADGSIRNLFVDGKEAFIQRLAQEDISLIASVHNERDGRRVSRMLNNSLARQRHIRYLVELADRDYIDGIEIHYEEMEAYDRNLFNQFIRELSVALHAKDKSLAVAVHAKSSDEGLWHGAASQDWEVIGKYADSIVIMAYDYSWATSEPGPIAPSDWVREIIDYGLTVVPEDKIILGLAAYGYDWSPHEGSAPQLSLENIEQLQNYYGIRHGRDGETNKPHFVYEHDNECPHEVWFEDAESTKSHIDLVLDKGLKGVSIWTLGGVTESYFTAISDRL